MSGIDSNVALLVATLDLALVRSVVGAIRTADLSGAAGVGKPLGDRFEPGRVFHPEPRVEPRAAFHPAPRFEPRPIERLALEPLHALPAREANCAALPCDPATSLPAHAPLFEPPWRKVPWDEPMPARLVVKVAPRPPDVVRTGKLIDFYL